jgi:hypothetical protein
MRVPGFDREVQVLDYGGRHITGTWKDDTAFPIAEALSHEPVKRRVSILSAGSNALSLAVALKTYGMEPPKVLADNGIAPEIHDAMRQAGCEIYLADLSERFLDKKDILALTKNRKGVELTSHEPELYSYVERFKKVLDAEPEYVFLPVGSYTAFNAMLAAAALKKAEALRRGSPYVAPHLMGATTKFSRSKADKLYSPFTPFRAKDIRRRIAAGVIHRSWGEQSGVFHVKEEYIRRGHEMLDDSFNAEPSSAGLGLLLQMQEKNLIPQDARIVVVNSGRLRI